MAWRGRQLTGFSKSGKTITMGYDADGLRSSKTVNGVKTTYQYVGDKLFYENRGNGDSFYYFYDSYGKLSAIYHHRNGIKVAYHVVTNAQGDVISLYNWSGTLVASYDYDAWGNCTIVSDTSSTGIATLNPFRYRGYYYDTDLGLYYLQSRYYDAEIGRFINADTTGLLAVSSGEITDKNLFSYCDNNPVARKDGTGDVWETVFDLVSLGFSIYDVVKNPNDVWAWVGLVGDAIDLIPFVAGVGETIKTIKVSAKVMDAADAYGDVTRITVIKIQKSSDEISNALTSYQRRKAVSDAWKIEYDDVMSGGQVVSRQWLPDEITQLKSRGKVAGYHGHHMYSVRAFPELAGDPKNIQFLSPMEHFKAHGGNWKNVTYGRFLG